MLRRVYLTSKNVVNRKKLKSSHWEVDDDFRIDRRSAKHSVRGTLISPAAGIEHRRTASVVQTVVATCLNRVLGADIENNATGDDVKWIDLDASRCPWYVSNAALLWSSHSRWQVHWWSLWDQTPERKTGRVLTQHKRDPYTEEVRSHRIGILYSNG